MVQFLDPKHQEQLDDQHITTGQQNAHVRVSSAAQMEVAAPGTFQVRPHPAETVGVPVTVMSLDWFN